VEGSERREGVGGGLEEPALFFGKFVTQILRPCDEVSRLVGEYVKFARGGAGGGVGKGGEWLVALQVRLGDFDARAQAGGGGGEGGDEENWPHVGWLSTYLACAYR
jgi:hypothetical protein